MLVSIDALIKPHLKSGFSMTSNNKHDQFQKELIQLIPSRDKIEILMKLLMEGRHAIFVHGLDFYSISPFYFFHTFHKFHFPLYELCLMCRYDTILFLLDHFKDRSKDILNIECRSIPVLNPYRNFYLKHLRANATDIPYIDREESFFEVFDELRQEVTCHKQELVFSLCYFSLYAYISLCIEEIPPNSSEELNEKRVKVITNLINLGCFSDPCIFDYVKSKENYNKVCDIGKKYDNLFFKLISEFTDYQCMNSAISMMKKVLDDSNEIIILFMHYIALTKSYSRRKDVDGNDWLFNFMRTYKDIIKPETNSIWKYHLQGYNYYWYCIPSKYLFYIYQVLHKNVNDYGGKHPYNLVWEPTLKRNDDESLYKDKNMLINLLHAAGESFSFKPKYHIEVPNQLFPQLSNCEKKTISVKAYICPFRGPGKEKHWLEPVIDDFQRSTIRIPLLFEIARKKIRDTIHSKNNQANMFSVIPKLPLPSILHKSLLFDVETIEEVINMEEEERRKKLNCVCKE